MPFIPSMLSTADSIPHPYGFVCAEADNTGPQMRAREAIADEHQLSAERERDLEGVSDLLRRSVCILGGSG